jgi:hypothetical protein
MKISIFTVAGSPPMIGSVVTDDANYITIEYPIIFHKEDSNIFTFPYMPLAKNGVVNFNKSSIISMSAVDEDVETYYVDLVNGMKQKKTEVPDKVLEKKIKESEIIYNKSKYLN